MNCILQMITIAFAAGSLGFAQDNTPEPFVERARHATEKYKDRAAAIRDGYRLIGRDFPAMGEHWIHVGFLFDGEIDAARPEVLNYAAVSGLPQLLGVAYALPLLKGEQPPDWPAGRDAWHDHFRSIEDETALPQHHSAGYAADLPRLAMLHAWIWVPNPAGMFAADNWALSYFRLGLTIPEDMQTATAAKALSLATGSAGYFLLRVEAAVNVTPAERSAIQAALERSRAQVLALMDGQTGPSLTPQQLHDLSDVWRELRAAIDASLAEEKRHHLHHLFLR